MTAQQMELGFGNRRSLRAAIARPSRASRANWWFERMRQVVEQAMDWEPAPPPRPEQTWFAGAHRQIEVGTAGNSAAENQQQSDQHEICE